VGLKQVALHAGVSVKTVSNVVRGTVRVSPSTRERVEASLAELGYRPNLSARQLRQGRTGVVALAVPALDAPYFSALARATIDAADAYGWTVLIDQTDGERDRELELLHGRGAHLVDGVLLSPLALGADDLSGRRPSVPVVLLGERVLHGPVDHVAIDNVAAAREATTHLLDLGRRRVAAVGWQSHERAGTAHLRLQGWREAHERAGLVPDDSLVVEVDRFGRATGAAAARELLARRDRPDALFCFDDLLAVGALRELALAGVRVPDDVAVTGVDAIEDGEFSVPSLTSVRPDLDTLAREALALLDRRVRGDHDGPQEVVVGHELVVRESTAGR
jgi:DNA-binding LacI/PurR family transcriptional regulator